MVVNEGQCWNNKTTCAHLHACSILALITSPNMWSPTYRICCIRTQGTRHSIIIHVWPKKPVVLYLYTCVHTTHTHTHTHIHTHTHTLHMHMQPPHNPTHPHPQWTHTTHPQWTHTPHPHLTHSTFPLAPVYLQKALEDPIGQQDWCASTVPLHISFPHLHCKPAQAGAPP